VRGPLKLAVELAGGGENGQFANAPSQSRLASQIMIGARYNALIAAVMGAPEQSGAAH
jgi:hypothetical protein